MQKTYFKYETVTFESLPVGGKRRLPHPAGEFSRDQFNGFLSFPKA
jgi:hypothetical protein